MGECTWALLKRDVEIMSECQEQFKEEIAQETRECNTKTKEEIEGGAALMSQLHSSNIITALTVYSSCHPIQTTKTANNINHPTEIRESPAK